MVLRTDGEQIGVQIDKDIDGPFGQRTLALRALEPFDFNKAPRELHGMVISLCRMIVGIMPEDAPQDNKDKWVCVVAICKKHPEHQVHFVATQHCFGADEDDNASSNLPRVVTFAELQQQGELIGRFERCTESDILWYTDYVQDNVAAPATHVSFPSAETHGPRGKRGGYDDQGKAITIMKED